MIKKRITDVEHKLTRHGRTYLHDDGTLYLNWTCAGISLMFTGTMLMAEMVASPGKEMEIGGNSPFAPRQIVERATWPYVAVFVDDDDEPSRYFELGCERSAYLLHATDQVETHKITLLKMTENPKGKAGISALLSDGEIAPATVPNDRMLIEFIGDSITCGFGNATNERDRLFFSQDENGWLSHAAVAARLLGAKASLVCFSGIAVMPWDMPTPGPMKMPTMSDLYPYTDRLAEEMLGKEAGFTPWDFTANQPDVIVMNLGTNDASIIAMGGLGAAGEQRFEHEYVKFLQLLRRLNGPEPWIVCALGSMDYFLFDNIRQAVGRYQQDNGDHRISCFKYGRIKFSEGFGGCGHPSLATHQRMGEEIAALIRTLPRSGARQ